MSSSDVFSPVMLPGTASNQLDTSLSAGLRYKCLGGHDVTLAALTRGKDGCLGVNLETVSTCRTDYRAVLVSNWRYMMNCLRMIWHLTTLR